MKPEELLLIMRDFIFWRNNMKIHVRWEIDDCLTECTKAATNFLNRILQY